MTLQTRELYESANGDRWLLARDPETGRAFVRHEPNAPSGGEIVHIEVGEFLVEDRGGPEHAELLRLIGSLIHQDKAD